MARGQKEKADAQLGLTNTTAAGYGKTAGGELGTLHEGANDLVNSQGFDPATLSAITGAGMGGVNAAFGDAEGKIKREAAINKNPAGTAGQLDTLAMNKGIAGGKEAGEIQIANAQFKSEQRKAGLELLNSLYGTNVGAETSLYGQGPGTLQARAAGGGWTQGFKDVLGGIGGVINPIKIPGLA